MKRFFKTIITLGVLAIIISCGLLTVKGYELYKDALQETSIEEKFSAIQSRPDFVEVEQLPEFYVNAVLSIEDKRFYKHNGVDILAIARAFKNDLLTMSFAEGGSTITQQIAKNEFFTQDKKLSRKVADAFMAFEIERKYSKEEIFEIYVNTIYFGDGYNGINQASYGYYNVPPQELNYCQSAMLAGVPNAPSVYAPTVNPTLAAERQEQVINKLVKNKVITQEAADGILAMC